MKSTKNNIEKHVGTDFESCENRDELKRSDNTVTKLITKGLKKGEENQPMTINDLPPEVIYLIFPYFHLGELSKSWWNLNSRLNSLITHPDFQVQCYLGACRCGDEYYRYSTILLRQIHPEQLICLAFDPHPDIYSMMERFNFEPYTKLKSLSFCYVEIAYDFERFKLMLQGKKQLEYLELILDCADDEKHLIDFFRIISTVSTLKTLILFVSEGNNLSFDSQMFTEMSSNLQQLSATCHRCNSYTTGFLCMTHVVLNLRYLKTFIGGGDAVLSSNYNLPPLVNLRTLILDCHRYILFSELQRILSIEKFPNLKKIELFSVRLEDTSNYLEAEQWKLFLMSPLLVKLKWLKLELKIRADHIGNNYKNAIMKAFDIEFFKRRRFSITYDPQGYSVMDFNLLCNCHKE